MNTSEAVISRASTRFPCRCCGSTKGTRFQPVIWKGLADEWGLSESEVAYIDRQQGEACLDCGCNLRSQALALAITRTFASNKPFREFARTIRCRLLRILEINTAGDLTRFFPRRSRHELRKYPDLDMMNMADVADGSYDLVIHSDTLEHVPDPLRALQECLRVLRPGGACCYTIPIIVGRLGRDRRGLPPSYHGGAGDKLDDYQVQTEYGADAWREVLTAGFAECRIVAVEGPAAHALVGIKGRDRRGHSL